jgi:UDP-3-O-[3-hydroxymyristoyl] glucosamine N-acyltransferase
MAQAVIHPSARIGSGVKLGENVVIEEGVEIGELTEIGHNVVILAGTRVGRQGDIRAGAILGRQPRSSPTSRRKIRAAQPPLVIGSECVIGCHVVIYAGNTLGDQVMIGDLASIREGNRVGNRVVIGRAASVEYETIIEEDVLIQTSAHITGNMHIEKGVFIGPEVVTANDNSMGRTPGPFKGPHIKQNARIGAGCVLLPGVVVGNGAVVAAGTTVSKNIPDGKLFYRVSRPAMAPVEF